MSERPLIALIASVGIAACATPDLSDLPEPPPGRSMSIDEEFIFVRQSGDGPDVVLLHGLGDSSLGWQFIEGPLLEAGHRVTVWDALGAGRSAKPTDGDYSLHAHCRRLERLLDELDIRRATLVGHSFGGTMALAFAHACPQRVTALCLIDPAAYREGALGGRWFWDVPWLAEIVLGLLPTATLVDFGLRQNFAAPARIPQQLRKLYIREALRDSVVSALIDQERQLVPDDPETWEAGHRTIEAPTLVLWGAKDALVPVAQGQRLARELRNAELSVLPDLAHSPQLEDPGLVLAHVLPFLREHAAPSCTPATSSRIGWPPRRGVHGRRKQ